MNTPDKSTDFEAVESDTQSKIFSRAKHLVPLCGPLWPLGPRPAAVIDVADGFAKICGYHDGARAKAEADKWALDRAYQLTHTCCNHCYPIVLQEKWEDLRGATEEELSVMDDHDLTLVEARAYIATAQEREEEEQEEAKKADAAWLEEQRAVDGWRESNE